MRNAWIVTGILALAMTLGGCIISDSLTTMVIDSNGSADLVIFRSNIRSNQEDEEKRSKEISDFVRDFDASKGDPFDHIHQCGGEVLEARWIRDEFPFSTLVEARLPNASALEKYGTLGKDEDQLRVVTRFESEGTRRKLEIRLAPAADQKPPPPDPTDAETLRKQMGDTVNEFRIVTAGGRIVNSRGFTLAGDRQSALLEGRRINDMLRAENEAVLFLEWEMIE
jgi:hypothetical protein